MRRTNDCCYVAIDVEDEYELCVDVSSLVNLDPVGGNDNG